MAVEDLIVRLGSLSVSSSARKSNKDVYDQEGENTLQELRAYVTGVQHSVFKTEESAAALKQIAKQDARSLLKIAHTGLRNTTGGVELLRLACDATQTLLSLSKFARTAVLVIEKLCYQAVARSVDLNEFLLGLRAAALLQTCLRQHGGGTAGTAGIPTLSAADSAAGGPHSEIFVLLDGGGIGDDSLRLCSFDAPGAEDSLEVAKLVSGASLNTCRCCLEVGSKEALVLMGGGLGRSAGMWIDRVGDLGGASTAEAYRDHLFKLLWRACSVSEQPGLAVRARDCLTGRRTALELLIRQGSAWNASVFVAHAHRAAVSLERRGGSVDGTSSVDYAAELSAFCHRALCSREGERWPAEEASGADNETQFHPGWVDWLQYAAGLQAKAGDGKEAQRLLQLAYDYVQRCSKRVSKLAQRCGINVVAACAAYSGVLKMQAAATITAQCALPHAGDSAGVNVNPPPKRKQPAKPNDRAGMRASDDACPASAVQSNMCQALEHLDILRNYLDELSIAVSSGSKAAVELDESVAAIVKGWKWAQKSCGVMAVWVERVKEMRGGDDSKLGLADWSALNERGLQVLGDLSQGLMSLRRSARQELVEKIPSGNTLADMAFDSHLRAAVVRISILSSATHMSRASNGRGAAAEVVGEKSSALQSLLAAERLCHSEREMLSSQHTRRVGAAWFGLGQGLVGCGKLATGLGALVRGCRLLESWIESAWGGGEAVDTDDEGTVRSDVLHSAQLDLRLSKLSKALVELGEFEAASIAVARALAFCPELWTAWHDGQQGPAAGAQALSERYVACRLRGAGTVNQKCQDPDHSSGEPQLVPMAATDVSAAVDDAMAYLTDSQSVPGRARSKRNSVEDLTSQLRRRGVPASVVAWVLLAECRAYRAQLPLHLSGGSQHTAGEHSSALTACIEGHRKATASVLRICEATTKEVLAHQWEAHAHLLSAWFEHDLFLVDVAAMKGLDVAESGAGAARSMADLSAGIQHAVRGSEITMKLGSEQSQSVATIASVCACVHAMLVRDLAEAGDGVRDAMRKGLDLLGDALKVLNGQHKSRYMTSLGPADASSISSCLEVLELHYSLHRDTWRMVRSAELKLLLTAYTQATGEPADRRANAAMQANALSSIGSAYHQAGIPKLPASFCSAAADKLCELEAANDLDGQGAGFDDGNGSSASPDCVRARAAADTLRGLCLAGQSEHALEAERTLLEARSGVSGGGRVNTPETAAYLECVAGLGLSWIYERRGRLADAMVELRQVLRLCLAWASLGGPLSELDRQVVSLSAPTGTSVHDEETGAQGAAAGLAEEGVGEEIGGVEEAIGASEGRDGRHHEGRGVVLSSRWLPVYLEGLARMGRLWRARGFASKASGYLRQGCVVSEPLRAARFLRKCLAEEVEVAAQMHRFDRADRLLHACQALLEKERRDQAASDVDGSPAFGCATCRMWFALGSCPANTATAKGKCVKKGSKKRASKFRVPSIAKTIARAEGICLRCHEFSLNAAELLVTESDVLRRKGDFRGALSACEQGQATLAPLLEAACQGLQVDSSLSFEHGTSTSDLKEDRGEGYDLGWRTLEILARLRLHQGRASSLLGAAEAAIELLMSCAQSDQAPVLVRATALYRLGRIYLDAADAVGAMEPLQQAEVLSRGSGAPKLIRRVRRALAVALTQRQRGEWKRNEVGIDSSWKVAALSSLSIGVTYCNQVMHKAAGRARKTDRAAELGEVSAGLRLFGVVSGGHVALRKPTVDERRRGEEPDDTCGGACLSEAVGMDLREEWPIVSLCLIAGEGATTHLLVTRLARGRPPLTASVPLSAEDTGLLKRWREIMDENRDTLRGHTADEAAAWGNKEKAAWWDRRVAVDAAVDALVQELQERWLEAHGLTPLIMGDIVGGGLDVVLEGVYEFAKERIEGAVRRSSGGVRGKDEMKRKGGTRARRAAAAEAANTAVSEPKSARASGMSELVRVCVRAGDVMSERAWFAVVRLALSGVPDQEASAECIAGEIHERVHAAFIAGGVVVMNDREVDSGDGNVPVKPSAASSGTIDLRSSLEIEAGRSSSDGPGRGDEKTAATPAAPGASRNRASVDEMTLSKMKVADLRQELSARGVATTGLKLKSDLLARLTEALRQEGDDGVGGRRSFDGTRGMPARTDKTAPTVVSVIHDKVGSKASHSISRQEAIKPNHAKEGDEIFDLKGTSGDSPSTGGAQRHPVVLVLDEALQAMPWEALPCQHGRPVTRVPAVPFVFSALATRWDRASSSDTSSTSGEESTTETGWAPSRDGIRINRGFYVLDPENNLLNTQKHLGQVFDGLRRRLGWCGMRGEAPSEEAMIKALQMDIFAYCGHGAGELFVGREAVAGQARCPVAVLMGCSSGRLKGYGDFEPSGMVSSYLVGGSPAVVANLWDVTDRDIDRFSVALFDLLLGAESEWSKGEGRRVATLAHAVAEARSECKMAFIIGHAPVCYGIPVAVAEASFRR